MLLKTPTNIGEGLQRLQHTRGLTDMVYVLSVNGNPLMPCTEAKARHLMQANKAICVKREPFSIKLTFECENKTQPIESRKTGDNAQNNLITICETCHKVYHAGKIALKQKVGSLSKKLALWE